MKRFLFPILLIATYFLAEKFLSLKIGLISILGLGIGEFIYSRYKEKTNDWMILVMTLFFCLPGIIALQTGYTFPEIVHTLITEISILIMIGIPAFSKKEISTMLPSSLRKGIQIDKSQERAVKNLMKIIILIIILHIVITVLSHHYSANTPFVNGPLLYILIGVFFIVLFIRNKLFLTKYKNTEWLPILDEQGKIIGQASRSDCHSGSKLLHPVVHLHIINSQKEVFLQKRSTKKDLLPNKWDTAVGGHVEYNERIEDALKRESFEELGITHFEAKFIARYIWESNTEKELVFSFICSKYDHIHMDNDEVSDGKFWTQKEIENSENKDFFTPNFLYEYNLILKKELREQR